MDWHYGGNLEIFNGILLAFAGLPEVCTIFLSRVISDFPHSSYNGYIPKQLTFFKKNFFFSFVFLFFKQRENKQIKKYYNIFDQYRP